MTVKIPAALPAADLTGRHKMPREVCCFRAKTTTSKSANPRLEEPQECKKQLELLCPVLLALRHTANVHTALLMVAG